MIRRIQISVFFKTRQRGFTLLELSIVIVILGVMMAFTIPNMRSMNDKNKLISSTRELVGLIRYARAEAITREYETEIRIDVEKGRFRLDLNEFKNEEVFGSGDRLERRRYQIEQIRNLPRDVKFTKVYAELDPQGVERITRLVFFPDGTATWAEINLQSKPKHKDSKVRNLRIEVSHSTGLPNVYDPGTQALKPPVQAQENNEEEDEMQSFEIIFNSLED
ncbi:GspH/FimT family pseudopilin [Candidatus Sumerlaeota bacterium]|nr:GspH/FimT family pseudopilin [Candidatus Sumerlaeota bacterium]